MTRRRPRGPDGIDRIIADFVPEADVLTRWEEVDAGRRRWIVVISRVPGRLALGYLRGPMNGGHWGHDAEQGEIALVGWRDSGLFVGAPPRVRECVARHARDLGVEALPARTPRPSDAT